MTTVIWLPPLVRAITTALLVLGASVAAETAGPFWGALIASLPVSAGPAYVLLAMQHDADFVATSALGSCAANAATGLFLIVYGLVARRLSAWPSLGAAVLVWLAASLAIQEIGWTPVAAFLLNVVVYVGGFKLLRAVPSNGPLPLRPIRRRWVDLPARALAVAAFVTLVVSLSSVIGATATGIAAVFPISLISLIAIVRSRIGARGSAVLVADALPPMLGFGMMLLVLHLTIPYWGIPIAYTIALLLTLSWSGALVFLRPHIKHSAALHRLRGAVERGRDGLG
ncbi:MAG: hypothetical protein JOZ94_23395 [Xanthobacteraceae bacterium]|nr:hypothetical protein [Xanthobacteraceae bacterium]MBV9627703.1 hypothetical protein [Xanthobacteraceae bacterium]